MTTRRARCAARLGAVALGLLLASLPFVQFGVGAGHGHAAAPHADHAPRHGGALRMVGDHHVELVERGRELLVFVSDARRRPLRAAAATARFDAAARAMTWRADHFATPIHADYDVVEVEVRLDRGAALVAALTREFLTADERLASRDGAPAARVDRSLLGGG